MNHFLSRRHLLQSTAAGLGYLAFAGMASFADQRNNAPNPLAPKPTPLPAKAKHVIFLSMVGAPSHVDSFDHKPLLSRDHGKAGKYGGTLLGSQWKFSQQGNSGLAISELFPELSKHADDLCLIRSMHSDQPVHATAQTQMHTGTAQFVRPSLGAWSLYGLGTENSDIPGFIALNPGPGMARHYGSAFLPAIYGGTAVGGAIRGGGGGGGNRPRRDFGAPPIPDVMNTRSSRRQQELQLEFIQHLNKHKLADTSAGHDVEGIIESFELAFRMQDAMPKIMDLSQESEKIQTMYGIDNNETAEFGRQCLMARKFVEAGVRFTLVSNGGWDHHRNLSEELPRSCRKIDQPIAALLQDLKQRDLLKETLIVWSGEFGRTPSAQGGDGRDHNNKGYTSWMAGGGVKGGFSYGATDEYGYAAVENPCHTHDWHATILHLLGLDHKKLTYRYAGRDYRLTDVYGNVQTEIIA